MTLAVLADSGPLYASTDPDDSHHSQAHQELARLRSDNVSVLVPFPILFESYTLIFRRLGSHVAHRWLNEIAYGATLINPTQQDCTRAIDMVRLYRDQSFTLFDALLAVISPRLNAPIWTFDRHFDVMRASVWR
jgi:predicted nucleic acid-binding protein